MRAIVTAVVAAIEACAAAVVGLLAVAVPVVLTWVVTFQISAEPSTVAGIVSGVWLLSHLVPLHFEIAQEAALQLGLAPEAFSFALSLAPLGITLITALFAAKAGSRLARRGGIGAAGLLGGAAGFAFVAWLAALGAGALSEWPMFAKVGVPTLVYAAAAGAAYVIASAVIGQGWWRQFVRALQRGLERATLPGFAAFPRRAAASFRLAGAMLLGLIGVSSVALAVAFAVGFADVIAIAQALQLDGFGSLLLFILQLALVPVGVIWSLAWLSGSGFQLAGEFSPFVDSSAMLPSLPVLGALPHSWGSVGALAPTLLVLLGVAIGLLLTRRSELRRASWVAAMTAAAAAAVITGLVTALLCFLASGDLGPGSLAGAGPLVWRTAGLVAGLSCLGLCAGVAVARVDYARLQARLPEPIAKLASGRAQAPDEADLAATGALTVDLSSVASTATPPSEGAPVIDLFAGVLREEPRRDVLADDAESAWGDADIDAERDGGLGDGFDAGFEGAYGEPVGEGAGGGPAQGADERDGGGIADGRTEAETTPDDPDTEYDTVPVEAFDNEAAAAAEAEAAAAAASAQFADSDALVEAFAWDSDAVDLAVPDEPGPAADADLGDETQEVAPKGWRSKLPGWRRGD